MRANANQAMSVNNHDESDEVVKEIVENIVDKIVVQTEMAALLPSSNRHEQQQGDQHSHFNNQMLPSQQLGRGEVSLASLENNPSRARATNTPRNTGKVPQSKKRARNNRSSDDTDHLGKSSLTACLSYLGYK